VQTADPGGANRESGPRAQDPNKNEIKKDNRKTRIKG
jgi:hypothetical protein